jgi:hypothetical protein
MKSRDSENELGQVLKPPKIGIGGGFRVARLFVPDLNSANAIRLTVRRDRGEARRQLARALEPRRVVS